MENYQYKEGKVIYIGKQWPIVFFHYSGINMRVEGDELLFLHTMYLTDTIRKTFIEPYAELMKTVFTHYLNTPIREVQIIPLDKGKNRIKTVMHYLNKFLPIDWAVAQVMKVKYRETRKLYSDK